jgi:hypothetical protein
MTECERRCDPKDRGVIDERFKMIYSREVPRREMRCPASRILIVLEISCRIWLWSAVLGLRAENCADDIWKRDEATEELFSELFWEHRWLGAYSNLDRVELALLSGKDLVGYCSQGTGVCQVGSISPRGHFLGSRWQIPYSTRRAAGAIHEDGLSQGEFNGLVETCRVHSRHFGAFQKYLEKREPTPIGMDDLVNAIRQQGLTSSGVKVIIPRFWMNDRAVPLIVESARSSDTVIVAIRRDVGWWAFKPASEVRIVTGERLRSTIRNVRAQRVATVGE